MAIEPFQVPLFPLSGHVLPGGQIRLRIFEPRYLRMVKEACAQSPNSYIGMCMFNDTGHVDDNTHIHRIGTLATVVDFETLPDGLLGITVAGQQLFAIESIETASDGLRVGRVRPFRSWPEHPLQVEYRDLAEQLMAVYQRYPELGAPPNSQQLDCANWVAQRWLEILPVAAEIKQTLLDQASCEPALGYLHELVQANCDD
jgi:Lon protease-like protein